MNIFKHLSILATLALIAVGAYADGPVPADAPPSRDVNVSHATNIAQASDEQLARAVGHFARAKSLLIAAMREFDLGTKIVNPDAILNSREWHADIYDRAEELVHILDPQPRANKQGVQYSPDSRLLNEAVR